MTGRGRIGHTTIAGRLGPLTGRARAVGLRGAGNTGIAPVGPVITGFFVAPLGTSPILWAAAGALVLSILVCLIVPQVSTVGQPSAATQREA